MSIVERAIKRSRDAKSARPLPGAKSEAARAAQRIEKASAIDPQLRIKPTPVALDSEICRERRLLVQSDAEGDGAAVAAYRILRTRLLHRARVNNWSSIAVTSAGPNDGKTLTALNLAFSMAREKSREIVLLDLDMRNPSVCRMLGVTPERELADYLEHGGDKRGVFFSVVKDNLLISGSVAPTEQASELLSSPRFDELMSDLAQGTIDPVILVDLPPVLVTDDALVVAPKIDAILVVASEGSTARTDLAKVMDLLSEFTVAGVVLNRAAETTAGYDYGYEAGERPSDATKAARST